mmetsp:Transcript_105825/g.326471  ORF Transcript_105825/g.326471 Transcript_105825/m.326471 type:complete len:238 (-) Transcript_105825:141-854(-)
MTLVKSSRMWGVQPSRRRKMLCGAVTRKGLRPYCIISERLAMRPTSSSPACRLASSSKTPSDSKQSWPRPSCRLSRLCWARAETESTPLPNSFSRTSAYSFSYGTCRHTSRFSLSSSRIRSDSARRDFSSRGKGKAEPCVPWPPGFLRFLSDLFFSGRMRQFTSFRSPCRSLTWSNSRAFNISGPRGASLTFAHLSKASSNSSAFSLCLHWAPSGCCGSAMVKSKPSGTPGRRGGAG